MDVTLDAVQMPTLRHKVGGLYSIKLQNIVYIGDVSKVKYFETSLFFCEIMNIEKEVSPNKKYVFPKNIAIVEFKGKHIVISVDTACWIILENKFQLDFFILLQQYSIKDALSRFDGDEDDAQWVVAQIEARRFDSMEIVKVNEHTCMIYLTSGCNMRCPHCFIYAGEAKANELSLEEVKTLLDNLKSARVNEITFSGGEIATRKDLLNIVEYAGCLNFKIQLMTNGSLWDEELIKKVSKNISSVQISIDGYSEDENAKVRGIGSFNKALECLGHFLNCGISVRLAITPFPSDDLEQKSVYYARFAKDLKNKYKDKDLEVVFTSGIMDGRSLKLTEEERQKYRTIMESVSTMYYGEEAKDYPFILTHLSRKIMDNCTYGCLNISSVGDVYMCSKMGLRPVANIRKDPFEKIINLSKLANEASNVNNLEPCRDCCLKYICGGGCRVVEFEDFKYGPAIFNKIPRRPCSKEQKEEFYDLMIRTNEDIFQ